jgi:hypothetical protein
MCKRKSWLFRQGKTLLIRMREKKESPIPRTEGRRVSKDPK